jgi:hypothetical protein
MDLWDGTLFRLSEEWTIDDDLDSVEDVVGNILGKLYWVIREAEQIFCT